MLSRWYIKNVKFLEWNTERSPKKIVRPTFPELYNPSKILFGSITGSTYDNIGFFCNHSIVVLAPWINLKGIYNRSISKKAKGEIRQKFEKVSRDFELKYLLIVINSRLGAYLINQNQRNKLSVYPDDLSQIPIKICQKEQQKKFVILTDSLLFLNATEERRIQFKDVIEFFDRRITDSLVYELYFHEKFHEDGLYPESKEYFSELTSKHLKPISYDRWAELYWKKQLDGTLTSEEEKELEKLETENTKTITDVCEAITNDKQIQQQVEKIRAHEWIKVIEG